MNLFIKIYILLCITCIFHISTVLCVGTEHRSRVLLKNNQEFELQHVQVITRHGDRTPLNKLPGDNTEWNCPSNILSIINPMPSNNNKFQGFPMGRVYELSYIDGEEFLNGNCSSGELTLKGAKEHYNLGTEFRRLYVEKYKFLSSKFDPNEIYIRSTDKRRTRLSAQSQIIGLYPDNTISENNRILKLNTVDEKTEYMYPNVAFCSILQPIQEKVTHSPEYLRHMQQYEPLREKFSKVFNVTPEDLMSWTALLDAFTCLQSHNKSIPSKISKHMINQVFEISGWQMGALVNNTDFIKYGVGKFVKELVDNMEYSFKHPNPKFRLYSGHDTTIGPILGALGIFNDVWPHYTSNVVLELLKDIRTEEYFVRVKYNGKAQVLPGCSNELCKFKDFKSYMSRVIPKNWEKECKTFS